LLPGGGVASLSGMNGRDDAANDGHVILVGLPGAGKSTVGRMLAERWGIPFADLDAEIERREGRSVSEIFAQYGEQYFRAREWEISGELARRPRMVLAPGGGWAANADAVALLRPSGRIIYLKTRPETALARLGAARVTRPLLAGPDPLRELQRLLEEREPHYLSADHTIDADVLDAQGVASALLQLAQGGWRG
jgi:shikimate kinase